MEEWINYKLRNTEGAVRPFARARQIPEPWIRKWLMVLSSTLQAWVGGRLLSSIPENLDGCHEEMHAVTMKSNLSRENSDVKTIQLRNLSRACIASPSVRPSQNPPFKEP